MMNVMRKEVAQDGARPKRNKLFRRVLLLWVVGCIHLRGSVNEYPLNRRIRKVSEGIRTIHCWM